MDDQTNQNQQSQQEPAQASDNSALEKIRQDAVKELLPLLDQIGSTPERKFELTMSALRVNFNETLLNKGLEAAKAIEDPQAKAEALIDVINETNYQESET
jgi:uncharacterized protein YfaQ (DUF2300 family)